MTPLIYQYRDYLKNRYGTVLHRVPIDAGFSCPHRKKDGSGGCTFCPGDGARAVQLGKSVELSEQIQKGVRFAKRRYKATEFMAYFQAFTTTFQSQEELISLTEKITAEANFRAIAFGTRPDALPQKVINWLAELQQQNPFDVWVELGVQSSHNQTLQQINRGHSWQQSVDAILRLAEADISIAAHLVIGLPGEDEADFLATIKQLCALPITAIKLHNLHIIRETELARQWKKAPFPLMNEYQYIEVLLQLLPYIPAEIPLIRLTTDTLPNRLIAPKWTMSKGQFRKALASQMRARGISQGSAMRRTDQASSSRPTEISAAATDDGSITFYNKQFNEHYHTLAGARSEAEKKYIIPGRLKERLQQGDVALLDICFGLGYNSLVACETAINAPHNLAITALEIDKTVVEKAAEVLQKVSLQLDWQQILRQLLETGFWQQENLSIAIHWGDARYQAQNLGQEFDLLWLDAFSSTKNSELWTVDFFKNLRKLCKTNAALLTYSAAIPVRSGLIEAGFHIGETRPFGRAEGGTIAVLPENSTSLPATISEQTRQRIKTTRGTPYRDPYGTRTNKEILRAREAEIVSRKQGAKNNLQS